MAMPDAAPATADPALEAKSEKELLELLEKKKAELAEAQRQHRLENPTLGDKVVNHARGFFDDIFSLPTSVWLMPVMLIVMGTKTSSPLQTAGLILITFFCIWIGKKLVDRMENSEWRQNLKSDADKVREQVKKEKEQKEARKAERKERFAEKKKEALANGTTTTTGSTKKNK